MTENTCLIQTKYDGADIIGVDVSIGHIGMKNSEGIYADPRKCFFKSNTHTLPIKSDNLGVVMTYVKQYLFSINFVGNVGFDLENSMATEEPDHKEIFMDGSDYGASSRVLYTRKIQTCLGLSLYEKETKKGSLHHIAGSEDFSLNNLKSIVDEEIMRLGNKLTVKFVSGLVTVTPDVMRRIYVTRSHVIEYLKDNLSPDSDIKSCFGKEVGEYIDYLSLDLIDGKSIVRKGKHPREIIARWEKEHEIYHANIK